MGKRSSSQIDDEADVWGFTKRCRIDDHFKKSRPESVIKSITPKNRNTKDCETSSGNSNNLVTRRLRSHNVPPPVVSHSVTDIFLHEGMDDAMQGVEQHGNSPISLHNVFHETIRTIATQTNRYVAIDETQNQIKAVLHTSTPPSHQLHLICQILLAFVQAAKRSGRCWHLARLEKEDFCNVARIMERLAYSMTEEEKHNFDGKLLLEIDAGFSQEFNLRNLMRGLRR